MKNVAFLLPTGANIASLETARQGFLVANEYLAAQGRPPGFSVRTLAVTREVRLDDGRITVQADAVLDEAGAVDICIAPPLLGSVSDVVLNNRALIEWLARHHRGGGEVASLCMGAALLAAGGLLDGQEAVVHWAAQGMYAQLFPEVQWVSDRVVMAGEGIYTSGGLFGRAPGAAPDRALRRPRHRHLVRQVFPAGLEPAEPAALRRVHGAEGACRPGGARGAGIHRGPLYGEDHGRGAGRPPRDGAAHAGAALSPGHRQQHRRIRSGCASRRPRSGWKTRARACPRSCTRSATTTPRRSATSSASTAACRRWATGNATSSVAAQAAAGLHKAYIIRTVFHIAAGRAFYNFRATRGLRASACRRIASASNSRRTAWIPSLYRPTAGRRRWRAPACACARAWAARRCAWSWPAPAAARGGRARQGA